MTTASTEIAYTVDLARECVADVIAADAELGRAFAEGIVQLADACVIGLPCERHGGAVHGREAEELRAGLEQLLDEHGPVPAGVSISPAVFEDLRRDLQRLLDRVDARDSLGYLEASDAAVPEPTYDLLQLQALAKATDDQLQAIVQGETGSQASTAMICGIAEELLLRRRVMAS